jgi:hypothetical protein
VFPLLSDNVQQPAAEIAETQAGAAATAGKEPIAVGVAAVEADDSEKVEKPPAMVSTLRTSGSPKLSASLLASMEHKLFAAPLSTSPAQKRTDEEPLVFIIFDVTVSLRYLF